MIMKTDRLFKYLPYILLALILTVVLYIRIRLINVPLERDEGEFAYMGQLLLQGIPPFTHAYTMKLPGASIMYAMIMFLFGQTTAAIHVGLLIVNGICIYLVYLLTYRLFDRNAAWVSCASYAVLSLSNSVNGVFAHATHFVVLFALAGFLLLLRSIEDRRISLMFISGICFGLAITMKQHAALLFIFAVVYLLWGILKNSAEDRKYSWQGVAIFLFGTIIPYALIVLLIVTLGDFTNFWFWTVQYAREYTSISSITKGFDNFKIVFGNIVKFQMTLWLIAGSGCVFLCISKRGCSDRFFVVGFIVFSFFSICPGLYFRGHYFVMLLPAVAIMIGAGISSIGLFLSSSKAARVAPFITTSLFVAAITSCLYHEQDNFFTFTPREVSRAAYGSSPFPEALQIADYIKRHSSRADKILVLGSEPEIFFYADRLSATGHIYMYGLMEGQPYAERMQKQMIREIEAARPMYVVFVNVPTSWMVRKSSVKSVLNWANGYVGNLYEQVGVIDIISPSTTRYLWDDKSAGYTPVSPYYVGVFKRKG
jgi:hypothetical protein